MDAHRVSTAANLVSVTHARLGTRAHDTGLGCVLGVEAVVAEAYVAVLGRCVREAKGIAIVDADLYRHVVVGGL
jgi:hypothetical protein